MTFVVGENCINCKHTDCVEVCPVDCFYEGPNFLVIHPDECIVFLELNAELALVWPNITEMKEKLADAEKWNGVPDKLQHLQR